ncbi:MAG: twin-arginine translocation pathway signal protein, partial [Anderseniella sp.]|nr:twin-arginine translocation pathway signal protein [Anderseniella sp.]
ETLMLAGQLTREDQLDPSSNGFQQGIEIYRGMLAATPAYAVLTSATNTRADQIETGRKWLRLNLMTTRLGLALHPVSQALQEYPEMATHYKSAHDMLAEPGHTVQMLGRLGFGPKVQETPRWPLETRIAHE